ncbi:Pyridine nucleotide-disulphide oxidoreductase [Halorientalis persicus]|jgi:NAD(P)H-nitrite reductase large subunit|uniref:Pyridine nucleotide-disulphide oxidoreductase n=1 Tax=Halorientalis persicus TaxID=1367881 RepID=A0A1H8DKL1_9EURY|nr:FAD-dependent oxidoreductase [Halorientalis persicus]SEN07067.1 Pyridine nucleotide-disulphide oxidoreductase [Halorientalis persicus]
MSASHVIIGDGIAGSSAAETIREQDPDADITVVTEEGEALYNRILIKEFAKGKLPEAPISIHEEDWYAERDIDLELNTVVTGVDTDEKVVTTHDSGEIEYDKLLLATGGTPTQLPVDNSDAEGIHHFWTFQDARAIREHADESDTGIVVGAGLLGIDLAAICAAQDIDAHYLMRGNRWWRYALSLEGAEIIHDALEENGVTPVFDSGVDHFTTDDDGVVTGAVDPDGEAYGGEFVGVAIGLNFNTEFLRDTDVELDDGIVVDEYMQTNVEDVYAAGDITRFYDTILDDYTQNGAWGSAKEQGAVAGQNMVADEASEAFRWVSSYSITHFDFPFLSFGHPTLGDDHAERKYSDTEWRRLAFKDGKLVGGVLIGDLAPQSKYKQLIREEREVADQKEVLLEQDVDLENLDAPAAAESE